jgi:CBS domain-containing protein
MESAMPVKAADVMTRRVITARPDDTVRQIAALLAKHAISAVPICDEQGLPIGVVSEGDLMRPFSKAYQLKRDWWLALLADGSDLAPNFLDYLRTEHRVARDLMTQPVITASEDTDLGELADMMTRHGVKRLPILRGGRLVGIVSRADVVRGIMALPAMAPAAA